MAIFAFYKILMNAVLKPRTLFLLIAFSFSSLYLFSQKNVDHQSLVWTRYSLKLKFDDHWSASQELEERTYWFPWRQHQFVSRSMGRYQFKNGFGIGGGFAYFLQALPQDPDVKEYSNQPEIRPEFELSYVHNLSDKISINHRHWTELRYFKIEDENYAFGNYRFRYKLELQYKPNKTITIKVFDEIFINAGNNISNNVFDQNRIGASIQYMPFKNFGFELGYINWYQQRPTGVDFYDRNIVRFTIHQIIDLSTPKKA